MMDGIKPDPVVEADDTESGYASKDGGDVAIHTETYAIKREALGESPMQVATFEHHAHFITRRYRPSSSLLAISRLYWHCSSALFR